MFARPKSINRMLRFSSSKRFSGFKSLWAILSRWEYSIEEIICWKSFLASYSSSLSRLAIRSKSSPPAAYSRTMKISVAVSMNSNILIVWGLLNRLRTFNSLLTFSHTPYYLIFFLLRILIATLWPVCSWKAILTIPKEPLPRFFENRYWPILISFKDII